MSTSSCIVWRPDLGETAETGAEYHTPLRGGRAARVMAELDAEARCAADPTALNSYEDGVEVMVRTAEGTVHRLSVVAEVNITYRVTRILPTAAPAPEQPLPVE